MSYIPGLRTDSAMPSSSPLIMTPLVRGKREFDIEAARKYYDGKVIILRIDPTVWTPTLDSSGKILVDGKDILGPNPPYWDGKPPRIVWLE